MRCARCLTVWFAKAPEPEPELAMTGPIAATAAPLREEIAAERPAAPQFRPIQEDAPQSAAAESADVAETMSAPDIEALSGGMPEGEEGAAGAEMPPSESAGDEMSAGADPGATVAAAAADDALPVMDAPPVAPHSGDEPRGYHAGARSADDAIDAAGIESFAARRLQRQRMRKRNPFASPGLPSAILLLIAVIGGLLVWRKDIVRLAPQTASFYAAIGIETNLRGLTFADIKTVRETQDGIPVLVVEGKIVSTASRPVEVPRIRLAARGSGGQELYSWTALPTRSILPPGEALVFVSRLASPPAEAREVMVRFFNRQDAASGTR